MMLDREYKRTLSTQTARPTHQRILRNIAESSNVSIVTDYNVFSCFHRQGSLLIVHIKSQYKENPSGWI
jgi:hypothetical protein